MQEKGEILLKLSEPRFQSETDRCYNLHFLLRLDKVVLVLPVRRPCRQDCLGGQITVHWRHMTDESSDCKSLTAHCRVVKQPNRRPTRPADAAILAADRHSGQVSRLGFLGSQIRDHNRRSIVSGMRGLRHLPLQPHQEPVQGEMQEWYILLIGRVFQMAQLRHQPVNLVICIFPPEKI